MSLSPHHFSLGIIAPDLGFRDAQGRVLVSHAFGRLADEVRRRVPHARICLPLLREHHRALTHELSFPASDVVGLPPLESVVKSQPHYFRTRAVVRDFGRKADVLWMRHPFQIPGALVGLKKPKLVQVLGDVRGVIQVSSDYRGVKRFLARQFARHSEATVKRLLREPATRVLTHGQEMWDKLGCHCGRVAVSSCLSEGEVERRADLRVGHPPRVLFVGYLRPEKGVHTLLDAFEQLRATRELKLTLVGGSDRASGTEAAVRERIDRSRFRADIEVLGMLDFGPQLFAQYRSHDVYVLASFSEGTPRTLVEARAFDCPVVATRVGGVPTSVSDECDGLLVPAGDSGAMALAIERLLDDSALRQTLVEGGRQRVANCTLEHFAGELVEELQSLVDEALPQRPTVETPVAAP